ncbi:MAG TPA: hypothetical protein O0Y06_08030 [Methanocorpusculum sp.]|nr:hypothetical protein [Methanocorpusculum sp.]HJK80833.1 hypothetical protein [Methanocorpusculum sp.]
MTPKDTTEKEAGNLTSYSSFDPLHKSVTDAEIISAAFTAYQNKIGGADKSIRHADVYIALGIGNHSRYWDERERIISSQRLRVLLRKAGFIPVVSGRNGGKKARYILSSAAGIVGGIAV